MRFSPSRTGWPTECRKAVKAAIEISPEDGVCVSPDCLDQRHCAIQRGAHEMQKAKLAGFAFFFSDGVTNDQSRSNSLIDVLERVFSSTRLTMTAQ